MHLVVHQLRVILTMHGHMNIKTDIFADDVPLNSYGLHFMQEVCRFSFFTTANCPNLKHFFAVFHLWQKTYEIPATLLSSLLQPKTADFYRCFAGYRSIFSCGATAKVVPRPPTCIFDGFRPHTDTRPVELSTND